MTDFQILNALNLQVNNENNEDADIFFVTNKQGNEELAARLQATKIFKNVYLFNFDYDKCKKMFDEIECEIMFENGYEEINL